MGKFIIKESKLREVVEEAVRQHLTENDMEEGLGKSIWNGITGAFGGDAKRVGNAMKSAGEGIKNTANRVAQGAKNAYDNVAQGAKNAYDNVAQGAKNAYDNVSNGVNTRVNAFKQNYQANQYAEKIQDAISTLRELQQKGIISGTKTGMALDELERCLRMGTKGRNGRATQASNRIGR